MVATPRVDAGNEPLAVPVRRRWPRLSSAHILVFSAGVLAFIANLAVLRPAADPPLVAISAVDILPGTVIDVEEHLDFVPIAADEAVVTRLVTSGHAETTDGMVATTRIPEGSPVGFGVLVEAGQAYGRRLMSIPIDRERAAGGRIVAGDRVDVIRASGDGAEFVAVDLEVVAIPEDRTSSFAGSSGYHIVVAVDADSSLALADALHGAAVHVVRSTGVPHSGVGDD